MFDKEPHRYGALGTLSQDSVALAEVLVLFRIVLADGVVQPGQLAAFERICERQFGIHPRDMPDLHLLLDSPQALSIETEAFSLLGQLDMAARSTLVEDMMRIARAHSGDHAREDVMIGRIADVLLLETGWIGDDKGDEEMSGAPEKAGLLADWVKGLINQHESLSRVANDPILTAELLLLVRMSFADKSVHAAEADAFAAICTRVLGLKGEELGDILKYLHDFGYETSDAQAAEMLAGLDEARKREILDHMEMVARADGGLDGPERRLIEATARRFGLA